MLARWASDPEKFLARPQNLLVPDDQTGLLPSPAIILAPVNKHFFYCNKIFQKKFFWQTFFVICVHKYIRYQLIMN